MHEESQMDFQNAIRKIEERGDFNRYAEVKPVFDERLASLKPGDHTERAICYYYLLVSYLKAQLVYETDEAIEYYEKLDSAFNKQLDVYKEDPHRFSWDEIQDFFRLADRCYGSLEFLYLKHDFKRRHLLAYEHKMDFRKEAAFFNREYGKWLEYLFIDATSSYGTNLVRWAMTTFGFTILMAALYAGIDLFLEEAYQTVQAESGHWYDYFYYSVITTTTVGFGDITPLHPITKIITSIQAFLGFLMLGIFIGMIQKRL